MFSICFYTYVISVKYFVFINLYFVLCKKKQGIFKEPEVRLGTVVHQVPLLYLLKFSWLIYKELTFKLTI